MAKKVKWILVPGSVELPEHRPIKPVGRVILFGKELTVEQTANYLKSMKPI